MGSGSIREAGTVVALDRDEMGAWLRGYRKGKQRGEEAVAAVWDAAYRAGVEDERKSAETGGVYPPARKNPYGEGADPRLTPG